VRAGVGLTSNHPPHLFPLLQVLFPCYPHIPPPTTIHRPVPQISLHIRPVRHSLILSLGQATLARPPCVPVHGHIGCSRMAQGVGGGKSVLSPRRVRWQTSRIRCTRTRVRHAVRICSLRFLSFLARLLTRVSLSMRRPRQGSNGRNRGATADQIGATSLSEEEMRRLNIEESFPYITVALVPIIHALTNTVAAVPSNKTKY
jgi:hypothetical protein